MTVTIIHVDGETHTHTMDLDLSKLDVIPGFNHHEGYPVTAYKTVDPPAGYPRNWTAEDVWESQSDKASHLYGDVYLITRQPIHVDEFSDDDINAIDEPTLYGFLKK